MFKRLTVNCKKCNTPFITSENRLAAGRGIFCSKSCSISFTQKKHGHATNGNSPTYTTWATMIQRCKNPKQSKFYMYGAVGIDVCDEWLTFDAFLADMGERPKGKTIDRIDGNKGYSKSNCRWATIIEQQSNLKNNVIVGIHYRSTQKSTDGIGNRTEYFTNGGGEVKKNMTYFVRLNNSES